MIQGPFKPKANYLTRLEHEARDFARNLVNGLALGTGIYIALSYLPVNQIV